MELMITWALIFCLLLKGRFSENSWRLKRLNFVDFHWSQAHLKPLCPTIPALCLLFAFVWLIVLLCICLILLKCYYRLVKLGKTSHYQSGLFKAYASPDCFVDIIPLGYNLWQANRTFAINKVAITNLKKRRRKSIWAKERKAVSLKLTHGFGKKWGTGRERRGKFSFWNLENRSREAVWPHFCGWELRLQHPSGFHKARELGKSLATDPARAYPDRKHRSEQQEGMGKFSFCTSVPPRQKKSALGSNREFSTPLDRFPKTYALTSSKVQPPVIWCYQLFQKCLIWF